MLNQFWTWFEPAYICWTECRTWNYVNHVSHQQHDCLSTDCLRIEQGQKNWCEQRSKVKNSVTKAVSWKQCPWPRSPTQSFAASSSAVPSASQSPLCPVAVVVVVVVCVLSAFKACLFATIYQNHEMACAVVSFSKQISAWPTLQLTFLISPLCWKNVTFKL